MVPQAALGTPQRAVRRRPLRWNNQRNPRPPIRGRRCWDVLQQLALAPVPQCDALAHAPVERAEVVLHLTEVGQQLTRQADELLEALPQRGVAHQRDVALPHALDLRVDLVAASRELAQARSGVDLAAFVHLPQQLEQREQARLGADKGALGQAGKPRDRFLGGRRQVEVRLVGAGRVELTMDHADLPRAASSPDLSSLVMRPVVPANLLGLPSACC